MAWHTVPHLNGHKKSPCMANKGLLGYTCEQQGEHGLQEWQGVSKRHRWLPDFGIDGDPSGDAPARQRTCSSQTSTHTTFQDAVHLFQLEYKSLTCLCSLVYPKNLNSPWHMIVFQHAVEGMKGLPCCITQTLSLRCSGNPRQPKGSSWCQSWSAVQRQAGGCSHPPEQLVTELRVPMLPLQVELGMSNLVSLRKEEH